MSLLQKLGLGLIVLVAIPVRGAMAQTFATPMEGSLATPVPSSVDTTGPALGEETPCARVAIQQWFPSLEEVAQYSDAPVQVYFLPLLDTGSVWSVPVAPPIREIRVVAPRHDEMPYEKDIDFGTAPGCEGASVMFNSAGEYPVEVSSDTGRYHFIVSVGGQDFVASNEEPNSSSEPRLEDLPKELVKLMTDQLVKPLPYLLMKSLDTAADVVVRSGSFAEALLHAIARPIEIPLADLYTISAGKDDPLRACVLDTLKERPVVVADSWQKVADSVKESYEKLNRNNAPANINGIQWWAAGRGSAGRMSIAADLLLKSNDELTRDRISELKGKVSGLTLYSSQSARGYEVDGNREHLLPLLADELTEILRRDDPKGNTRFVTVAGWETDHPKCIPASSVGRPAYLTNSIAHGLGVKVATTVQFTRSLTGVEAFILR